MNEIQKNEFLESAKMHLKSMRDKIIAKIDYREKRTDNMKKERGGVILSDAIAQQILMAHNLDQIENLKQLFPSPYFTRCDFGINDELKTMYFGKFSFSDENIYSWITPAAALRFENPGVASYSRPDGLVQSGIVERKDNYMIVDGKIIFLSTESIGHARELVHQENFTKQKSGFILPEVIEQMEKSQDQVIRAHHDGPFIIAGPAGSGKTTLALHRVAYLIQSPETSEFYRPETILVLVQDSGSKKYFSQLLPDLGIKGVSIVTFSEWSMKVLKLEDHSFLTDYKISEEEKIKYEYSKLQALNNLPESDYSNNIYRILEKAYDQYFNQEQKIILKWQKENKLLDRFDLTILLSYYKKQHGQFNIENEYYEQLSNGSYRKRKMSFSAQYNLIIVDEFQNYLPEQLAILNSCINPRLKSLVYVGDLSQQTQLGTVRSLASVGIEIDKERLVRLEKVYRNTKEILNYIKKIGYQIEIPSQIKNGDPVVETKLNGQINEIEFIQNQLNTNTVAVGILSRHKDYLTPFKNAFQDNAVVHCLSFYEAQGVEFDCVFIVGDTNLKPNYANITLELAEEIAAIEKDLLYVALTRAISKLYILS